MPLESPTPPSPEMADIGLGGDEGHRHLVAYLAAAQVGIHDECVFVGRAEAGCTLHCPDDNRARVLGETLPGFMRLHRVIDIADGVGMPAMRPQTLDFIEGQLGSGGDHQVIVIHRLSVVEFQLVLVRMHDASRRSR